MKLLGSRTQESPGVQVQEPERTRSADMKKILFQGDSVTDAGRTEEGGESLGYGYPMLAAEAFRKAGEEVAVINRGISGNRTVDLVERWERDCIQLQPDVLTILIGINDCWRKYDSNDETLIEEFRERLERLVREAKEKTKAGIILMEPFVLPYPEDRKAWRVTLDPEIHAVRELAGKYGTGFVPLDGIMNREAVRFGYTAVSEDGVHPTKLGHEVIAGAWMEAYRELSGAK